jgi:hypothetical protein
MRSLLIPLKRICKTADQVVEVVEKIFKDIHERRVLTQFSVAKEMRKGAGRAFADAVILQPNVSGIGFDVKKFFSSRER